MIKEETTNIVNFMIPGVGVLLLRCGHIIHIVEMHFSYKKYSSLLRSMVQTKLSVYNVVMMTKEGPTKIVNFRTPGAGVLVLVRGHISHIVKIHYSFKNLLLYSQA